MLNTYRLLNLNLMFMYNTGTRASEVVNMKISDIHIGSSNTVSVVYVRGKGNKTRPCPLWDTTVKLIEPFLHRSKDEAVFLNKYGNPITRFGIYELVTKYAVKAAELMPSIAEKNVSPHTIRHSTATHLLESGVDINTIRSWLGHVSINTTNIYAEINLKMKVKAIESCNLNNPDLKVKPITDQSIITFLKSLQSDGIFRQIVINMDTSILQIPHHILPAGIGIGYRLSGQAGWTVFYPFCFHP